MMKNSDFTLHYITYKFITRPTGNICQSACESSAAMAPERLHVAGFKQFSFKTLKALSKTTEHHDLYRDSPSLKKICRDFADFLP